MRLTITRRDSELTPDCTIKYTDEPEGLYNGRDYWRWFNAVGSWFLWNNVTSGGFTFSFLTAILGEHGTFRWNKLSSGGIVVNTGIYRAGLTAVGDIVVSEYVPTPDIYKVIEDNPINNGSLVIATNGLLTQSYGTVHNNPTIECLSGQYQDKFKRNRFYKGDSSF